MRQNSILISINRHILHMVTEFFLTDWMQENPMQGCGPPRCRDLLSAA